MPAVSVLIPSRGRPGSLRRAVASLRDQAGVPVEILVAADADDHRTIVTAAETADVTIITSRFGYANLHRYYNLLARVASGEWLLLFNDDAHIPVDSRDWAVRVADHTGQDVILDPESNLGREFVAFPITPRRFVEAWGHYSLSPHCDSWHQDIGRALGIIRPVEVNIWHDRFDLTGGHDDQTWREGRTGLRHQEYFGAEMTRLRERDAQVLRDLIGRPV
jgi:glycosyltransferase involved in cell wall biosynthesis